MKQRSENANVSSASILAAPAKIKRKRTFYEEQSKQDMMFVVDGTDVDAHNF